MKQSIHESVQTKGSYLYNRQKNKNSFLNSCIMLAKSTLGFAVLSNQIYFFETGYFLGFVISILITMLVGYSMLLTCETSHSIESNNENAVIENFEQLPQYVFQSKRTISVVYLGRPFLTSTFSFTRKKPKKSN